jgi:Amt family ammonium transporter
VRKRALRIISGLGGAAAIIAVVPSVAFAQEGPDTQAILDNIWVFIAGCLVFFMQAGFALVEAGLTRAKNVVNIFAKNIADAIVGVLAFFACGYAFAFGGGGKWIGDSAFFLSGQDLSIPADGGLSVATTFFFQVVFAATAVTIASGAMAERTKFSSYLIFSALMTAFIYPVVVHWTWGGGLIAGWSVGDAVYSDFAGSGIVHMTGGVAALMGAMALGPRIGKYDANGKPRAIPGHSIPFAVLGVFILWLGWFGFNPGSELAADGTLRRRPARRAPGRRGSNDRSPLRTCAYRRTARAAARDGAAGRARSRAGWGVAPPPPVGPPRSPRAGRGSRAVRSGARETPGRRMRSS